MAAGQPHAHSRPPGHSLPPLVGLATCHMAGLQAVLDSIAELGAARAVSIADLLLPVRSNSANKKFVSRTWKPILGEVLAGGQGRAATAIASIADLDRALAVCGDKDAVAAFEENCGSAIRAAFAAASQGGTPGDAVPESGSGADMPLEEAALASIQQHGAASATTIAQLLFPQRTPAACAKLVSRTWRPALQRRRTGTGRGCPPSTAIATAAELDCVLSATNDAGAVAAFQDGVGARIRAAFVAAAAGQSNDGNAGGKSPESDVVGPSPAAVAEAARSPARRYSSPEPPALPPGPH